MKILHVNSYFEQYFYENLFSRQRAKGAETVVAVPCAYKDSRYDYLQDQYDVLHCYPKWFRLFIRLKAKRIAKTILNRVPLDGIDLIHAHSLSSNGCPAYELHKRTGLPYILAVRGSDLATFLPKMRPYRGYYKKALLHAKRIVFISEAGKQHFLRLFHKDPKFISRIESKFSVCPNGISNFFFEQKPTVHTTPSSPCRILFSARNTKVKNSVFLARAIANQKLDCRLTVLGKTEDAEIEAQLKEYPFVTRVEAVPLEETIRFYREHDVFAMISKYETFGLTYIEALSQGLPVLYTKGTGIDGTFPEGEVGFHVEYNDEADFAKKLNMVLADYPQIISRCIPASLRFRWDAIVDVYFAIYEGVLANAR